MATTWNKGTQKPDEPDVYERDYKYGVPQYCKFDGQNWYCAAGSVESARTILVVSDDQNVKWRKVQREEVAA